MNVFEWSYLRSCLNEVAIGLRLRAKRQYLLQSPEKVVVQSDWRGFSVAGLPRGYVLQFEVANGG